ncbi:hypothetical protein [Pedobacter sp. ASV12]|uniref:hypothetical protein n=1 Tax=Pedobacter sp. ASV12 TaxID=2795120 RepID=UPI0018EC03B9|nr:hypothetical protein [Pedobacter sp. ASV12]
MKNLLKISLVASLLFIAYGAHATDDLLVRVKNSNEKSVSFFLNEAKVMNVAFYTVNDDLIYQQNVRTTGAAIKTYDLNAFPDGDYKLKVEADLKLTEYQLHIEDGKAVLSKPSVVNLLSAALTKEKSIVTLDLKNIAKEVVDVQVLNEYNDQLYSEKISEKTSLVKKFDIAQVNAKELTFVVKTKNKEFVETVKVQ